MFADYYKIDMSEMKETLTSTEEKRYVLFPIRYPKIWEMQKKQQACFWQTEEMDLSKDKDDWEKS